MGEMRMGSPVLEVGERLVKGLGKSAELFLVRDTRFARGKAVGEGTERGDVRPRQGVEDGEAARDPESDLWSEDTAVV